MDDVSKIKISLALFKLVNEPADGTLLDIDGLIPHSDEVLDTLKDDNEEK